MINKTLFFKITKHVIIVIAFILGLLGFLQKLPMTTVIPITIVMFFTEIILEALEMYFKKSNNRIEKFLYFFRLGLICFSLFIIVIVIIKDLIQ